MKFYQEYLLVIHVIVHMVYGEGSGNPLQYSCLENPVDRGAWWATVHEVEKNQTWLSMHTEKK